MKTVSGPEFGLTDRQQEKLIERQAARIASLSGALKRIAVNRPLDPALVKFCEVVLDGLATFTDDGRLDCER